MIKILIADDHPVVRLGTKQIIEDASDMVVLDEAGDGDEVISKVYEKSFDVILLDISMPGRDGLDVLKQLQTERPNIPVLILSMYTEEEYAIRALRSGASGYLTKESAPYELITALRTVSEGKKYISSSLAQILASSVGTPDDIHPHNTLSEREYQVMQMICSGKNTPEIARELSISVKTVSTYRTRTLKKMNLKNDVELTHYAIQNHLLDQR